MQVSYPTFVGTPAECTTSQEGWISEGHEWLMQRVRRIFGKNKFGTGFITRCARAWRVPGLVTTLDEWYIGPIC